MQVGPGLAYQDGVHAQRPRRLEQLLLDVAHGKGERGALLVGEVCGAVDMALRVKQQPAWQRRWAANLFATRTCLLIFVWETLSGLQAKRDTRARARTIVSGCVVPSASGGCLALWLWCTSHSESSYSTSIGHPLSAGSFCRQMGHSATCEGCFIRPAGQREQGGRRLGSLAAQRRRTFVHGPAAADRATSAIHTGR